MRGTGTATTTKVAPARAHAESRRGIRGGPRPCGSWARWAMPASAKRLPERAPEAPVAEDGDGVVGMGHTVTSLRFPSGLTVQILAVLRIARSIAAVVQSPASCACAPAPLVASILRRRRRPHAPAKGAARAGGWPSGSRAEGGLCAGTDDALCAGASAAGVHGSRALRVERDRRRARRRVRGADALRGVCARRPASVRVRRQALARRARCHAGRAPRPGHAGPSLRRGGRGGMCSGPPLALRPARRERRPARSPGPARPHGTPSTTAQSARPDACYQMGILFYTGRDSFPRDRTQCGPRAYGRGWNVGEARAPATTSRTRSHTEKVWGAIWSAPPRRSTRHAASASRSGAATSGTCEEHGSGVRRDIGRARALYRDACATGDPYGCLHAAMLVAEDSGTPRDPPRALPYWVRRCAANEAGGRPARSWASSTKTAPTSLRATRPRASKRCPARASSARAARLRLGQEPLGGLDRFSLALIGPIYALAVLGVREDACARRPRSWTR